MSPFPLEVLLAFVGGLVTVASPCTLAVVPVVLAVGATGTRRRLVGLLVGFAAVFLVATVVVAGALLATGLSTSGLRAIAVLALLASGLLVALPALGNRFSRFLASLRSPAIARPLTSTPRHGGLVTGLIAGASMGLIWAPCTGPIMAGVIVTAAVEGPSVGGVAIAGAYVVGASLSLAGIALVAARALGRVGAQGAERIRRSFGVALLASALLLASGLSTRLDLAVVPALTEDVAAASGPADDTPPVPLHDLGPAPELDGITAWINSDARSLASLRGKVVLVQFWTFGCINCQHVLPYVKAWDAAYRDAGLAVIGVHTPELSFERELDNVRSAIRDEDIRYPVAFDPEYRTWRAYGNQYWPAFYFVDRSGHIRYTHAGEGDYARSELVIRQLLAEAG